MYMKPDYYFYLHLNIVLIMCVLAYVKVRTWSAKNLNILLTYLRRNCVTNKCDANILHKIYDIESNIECENKA